MSKPADRTPKWDLSKQSGVVPEADQSTCLDEEFAVQMHRQADRARIRIEADRLLAQMAHFEAKYRMGFEEFGARLVPGATAEQEADYLAWSKLAERYRMLQSQLEPSKGERR